MQSFVFNITNRCNFNCKTCLRESSSSQDLSCDEIGKVIPILKRLGVQHIALTGGEPILHPQFTQVLDAIVGSGIKFSLVTNCWLHAQYCTCLARYHEHVKYVAVSLDGHHADLHDKNRQKGSFERTIAAIDNFQARGYRVRLSHIVNKFNFAHILQYFKLIKGFNVDVNVGRVIATNANQQWRISTQQAKAMLLKINSAAKGYQQKITPTASLGLTPQLYFCSNFSTMRDVTLRFDGKICFCCDSLLDNDGAVLGDIRQEPFEEILSRFGRFLGRIITKRIEALMQGHRLSHNDCDFCNDTLRATVAR